MRTVGRAPAALGALRGREWRLFGIRLWADAERIHAEHLAATLPRLGAAARIAGGKAASARQELRAVAQADRRPEVRRYRDLLAELGAHSADDLARRVEAARPAADQAEIQRLVQSVDRIEAGPEPGRLQYRWSTIDNVELQRREALFARHKLLAKQALAKEFRRRSPQDYLAWEAQLPRQPGRHRRRPAPGGRG